MLKLCVHLLNVPKPFYRILNTLLVWIRSIALQLLNERIEHNFTYEWRVIKNQLESKATRKKA